MSNLTIDRTAIMANLMIAYKDGNLSKYLEVLKRCESWMNPFYYNFFFNLSKSSMFARKGFYKNL